MAKTPIKLQTSGDDIRKMTEEQWKEYRLKSWLRKREYYNQDIPNYYLPNKDSYAKYLDNVQKRIERRENKQQ